MHFQFDMSATSFPHAEPTPVPESPTEDLLRQLLGVQREQLAYLRAFLTAHDGAARWRAFLARWRDDFSELPASCRQALPILERAYGKLIAELTESLCLNGADALDNDFALQDFLDRYGMRLTQLGTMLNLLAPFADASSPSESA
jgi:hypothetical protein